eukprot:461387_1
MNANKHNRSYFEIKNAVTRYIKQQTSAGRTRKYISNIILRDIYYRSKDFYQITEFHACSKKELIYLIYGYLKQINTEYTTKKPMCFNGSPLQIIYSFSMGSVGYNILLETVITSPVCAVMHEYRHENLYKWRKMLKKAINSFMNSWRHIYSGPNH